MKHFEKHHFLSTALSPMRLLRSLAFMLVMSAVMFLALSPPASAQFLSPPQTTMVTVTSPFPTPLLTLKKGDQVEIQMLLDTTDVNEDGEGEPAIVLLAGSPILTVSDYEIPATTTFTVGTDGQILSAYIPGADGDENALVVITVNSVSTSRYSQEQRDQFTNIAILLGAKAGGDGAIAAACALAPDPSVTKVCAVGFGVLSGLDGILSGIYAYLAKDPVDPNFSMIAQPVVPTVPMFTAGNGVNQAEADAFNALFTNEEQQIAYGQAAITAVNRASGAAAAGNSQWETAQLQAASQFNIQLGTLASVNPTLRLNLKTVLIAAGFPTQTLTSQEALNFEQNISTNGLPTFLLQPITQLGADSATIQNYTKLLLVQDVNAIAGNYPDQLTDSALSNAFLQTAQALTPTGATDISSLIRATSSGLVYKRLAKAFYGTITITNTSGHALTGPLQVVLTNMTPGVTILGNFTANVTSLPAGASVQVPIQFSNPSYAPVHYSVSVFTGNFTP